MINRALRTVEGAIAGYLKQPLLRALAQMDPTNISGALDTFVAGRYEQLIQDRRRLFFEELDKGAELSPELVKSDEFLHCFDITFRAVERTQHAEKIRRFAQLLLGSVVGGTFTDVCDYEELMKVVDELSPREFKILMALEKYEQQYYRDGQFYNRRIGFEGKLHEIVAQELGVPVSEIDDDDLRGVVVRLNRTGCYALMGWRRGPAIDCRLTGVYFRLKRILQHSEGKSNEG